MLAIKITRRNLLKLGALGAASAVLTGCKWPRRWEVLEPYVTPPEEQLAGQATWYASTCRQCPAGCGIIVRIMNGRALKIEGNPEHPLNQGKLCARGQAGLQILYNPDRLEGPVTQSERGSRNYKSISWDEGVNTLYTKIQAAGGKVAVWCGSTTSGHLYDLFRRFTTAIGAPAPLVYDLYTDFNGYAPLEDATQAVFGQRQLPAYDLGQADVILSFGADFLGTWLSATRYGVEYGRFRSQSIGKRGYLVQIESRMSTTGAKADQWVPVQPGTEALVAQALARIITDQNLGLAGRADRAKQVAGQVDLNSVATASGIPVDTLAQLARAFASTERVVAIPGSPLSGGPSAAEANQAVQALNYIAGNIGQPGGVALSSDTQLSSLGKLEFSPLSDVQDLIGKMNSGEVQVLLVYGANPAYDLPAKLGVAQAIAKVPFVVSFTPIVDETAVLANMILPDRTYLEAWGYAVVSPNFGVPILGSQQPVVEPVFDLRSTGDVLLTVARGIPAAASAMPWSDEVQYLKEVVGNLPAGDNGGSTPEVKWSRFRQHGGWWSTSAKNTPAQAPTPPGPIDLPAAAYQGSEQAYPYFLSLYLPNLLSDGRGASQPWLQGSPDTNTSISWQTWVEINPQTAQKLGLNNGDIVKVSSTVGDLEAPVYLYPAVRPDTIAIPLGQGHTDYGRYARDRGSNAVQLVDVSSSGQNARLAYSVVRASLTPTGKRMDLAVFENVTGVTEGFPNKSIPGS